MDAYCQNGIMIAATNHQELLDDALKFLAVLPSNDEIRVSKRAVTSGSSNLFAR